MDFMPITPKAVLMLLVTTMLTSCAIVSSLQIITDAPSSYAAASATDAKFIVSLDSRDDEFYADSQQIKVMTDAFGKKYACHLPDTSSSAIMPAPHDQEVGSGTSKSPFELLSALNALCLYRQEGLWTYEMCYKKQARQFRQEGSQRVEDFSCGKYTGDDEQSEEIKDDARISSQPVRYVAHIMKGGAECTLTGQQRSAEIRFTCMREAKDNMIVSVKEFPTCNYIFTVATPFLCKHPAFVPQPDCTFTIPCEPISAASDASSQQCKDAGMDVRVNQAEKEAMMGSKHSLTEAPLGQEGRQDAQEWAAYKFHDDGNHAQDDEDDKYLDNFDD